MLLKRKLMSAALAVLCSMTATAQLGAEVQWTDCSNNIGDNDFNDCEHLNGDNAPWKTWGSEFTYEFGGNNTNRCLQIWNGSGQAFDVLQEISGLTPGYYMVKMQGFFRADQYAAIDSRHAYLYAHLGGGEALVQTPLRSILSGAKAEGVDDEYYNKHELGYIPDRMASAATAFENGDYPNELIIHVTEGKTLTIGVHRDNGSSHNEWTVIDKFELYYLGTHDEVMATADEARYFRNVATGKFLNVGGYWEFQPMLSDDAIDIKPVHITEVGKYLFDTNIRGGHWDNPYKHYLGVSESVTRMGCWAHLWSMEEVADNKYVFTHDDGSSYMGYDGSSDVISFELTNKNDPNVQWEMLTKEQMMEEMKLATAENKKNATFLLPGAHFTFYNERNWTNTWSGTHSTDYWVHGSVGEKESNSAAEIKIDDFYQKLEGVPNGFYEIKAQGFYRGGTAENFDATLRNAYLYANDQETPLMSIVTGAIATDPTTDDYWESFYKHPTWNWLPGEIASAARAIYNGKYGTETIKVYVTDNTLRIGVKKKATVEGDWTVIDNIDIHYYGSINIVDGSTDNFEQLQDEKYHNLTYTRTLPNTEWNSLYLPFEIEVTEELLLDYEVAYANNLHAYDRNDDGAIDDLEMEIIKIKQGTLHDNHPYFIRAKNDGVKNLTLAQKNVTLYVTEENTMTCQSFYTQFALTGIYNRMGADDFGAKEGAHYAISTEGGWWKTQGLSPFRVYMTITQLEGSPVKVDTAAFSRVRIRVQGENATDIAPSTINNVLPTTIYDIMGRPVMNPQRGAIYIVNGKKVVY